MYAGFQQWWAQPFNATMSVPKWFLFVGLLIVLLIVWKTITSHAMDLA